MWFYLTRANTYPVTSMPLRMEAALGTTQELNWRANTYPVISIPLLIAVVIGFAQIIGRVFNSMKYFF